MRNFKAIFSFLSFLAMTMMILVACSNESEKSTAEIQNENIISISVDKTTIPVGAYAGNVPLSQIELNITYTDGHTSRISLQKNFLTIQSQNKLDLPGLHSLEVIYEQCKCNFSIDLQDPNDVKYRLTIYGGIPVRVNGELVNVSLNNDGFFTAMYNKNSEIIISWIPEYGNQFDCWEANGELIDTQESTLVTMNAEYTYRAHSSRNVHTVTFITYNANYPVSPIKTRTINGEEDIAEEMHMDKYVFAGWTNEEISQAESLSGSFSGEFLEYPFQVLNDTTLYAVWLPLGFTLANVSVTSIGGKTVDGKQILKYEGDLETLDIPSAIDGGEIISIAKDAFAQDNSKKIITITIPASIIDIEEGAFRNCSSLQSFYVDPGSVTFSAESGILYKNNKTLLVSYPLGKIAATYTIGAGVNEICDYAFHNALVGSITVASSIVRFGSHAFDSVHTDNVDFSILLCQNISKLGDNVFSDKLQAIYVDISQANAYKLLFKDFSTIIVTDRTNINSVYVHEGNNETNILFRLINGKYFDIKIKSAEILGATRTISSITIPESLVGRNTEFTVTSIAECAFEDCIYLEDVILPKKLERVCDDAFVGTKWLAGLEEPVIIANNTLYKYLGEDSIYVLRADIKRIAESAFAQNKSLTKIDLSNNAILERIDAYAFWECKSFMAFAPGTNASFLLIRPTLEKIAAYAFGRTAFTTITTQNNATGAGGSLKEIGEYAFSDCYYLENVDFGMNSLTSIEPVAFMNCYAIQSYTVSPNNSVFTSFNGILYKKLANDTYSLFMYPAGKMLPIFNPSKPSEDTNISVVSLGDYSLWYSNIGALEFSDEISVTNALAFNLPSIMYVRFLNEYNLNNSSFMSTFANKTGAEKFMFSEALAPTMISAFFGGDETLINKYTTTDVPCLIHIGDDDDNFLYCVEGARLSIIGTKRTSECRNLIIKSRVLVDRIYYDTKMIKKYAMIGYNLKTIDVSAVSEFSDYALSGAYALQSITLNENDVSKIPSIFENSLGENFNNGLMIYVNIDPELQNSYFDKWGDIIDTFTYQEVDGTEKKASRYLIYDEPFSVFVYEDDENISHTISVERSTIDEDNLIIANEKRTGHVIDYWYDTATQNSAEFTDGMDINYNSVYQCVWKPETYLIYFMVPNGITLNFNAEFIGNDGEYSKYKIVLDYGSEYSFTVTRNELETNTYIFNGWNCSERIIPETGVWDIVLQDNQTVLYPSRFFKDYYITYDTTDTSVDLNGETNQALNYGKSYILTIPKKNGYKFLGWETVINGKQIKLTDENGAGLTEWLITIQPLKVYSRWEAKIINVSLFLGENDYYSNVSIEFGTKNYFIEFDATNVNEFLRHKYEEKINYFSGWADNDGQIYVDSDGNALSEWDIFDNPQLYAVWPEFVYSCEDLISVVSANSHVSIVLQDDFELTQTINVNYTGILNGNNHIITVNQTINNSLQDFSTGIFTQNSGVIKNLHIIANININVSGNYTGNAYISTLCGKNEGTIQNVKVNVTKMSITFSEITGNVFLGGIVAENSNEILNIEATLNDIDISYSSSNGDFYLGGVIGLNSGKIIIDFIDILSYKVFVDDKLFGGEKRTVGCVSGCNSGKIAGSCRYTVTNVIEEYEVYIESDRAQDISQNGNWEIYYMDFYCYDTKFGIVSADSGYISGKQYYEKQVRNEDFFSLKENRFGLFSSVEVSQLSFSIIIN